MSSYFKNIGTAWSTMASGLKLTLRHLSEARNSRKPYGIAEEDYFNLEKGIVTLQYPAESLPVPDTGRYRLHNEIDDCIVCDKCAKVCPVDCIEIDSILSPETFGMTSDGTPKRIHAARFDIDMSKCCFCGLCTTICPTECLTMTKVYDFSEFEVEDHVYSFSEMSLVEIAQKRKEWEDHQAKKDKERATGESSATANVKPVMKPKAGKPILRPKPVSKPSSAEASQLKGLSEDKPKPKFRPKPMIKRKPKDDDGQ